MPPCTLLRGPRCMFRLNKRRSGCTRCRRNRRFRWVCLDWNIPPWRGYMFQRRGSCPGVNTKRCPSVYTRRFDNCHSACMHCYLYRRFRWVLRGWSMCPCPGHTRPPSGKYHSPCKRQPFPQHNCRFGMCRFVYTNCRRCTTLHWACLDWSIYLWRGCMCPRCDIGQERCM